MSTTATATTTTTAEGAARTAPSGRRVLRALHGTPAEGVPPWARRMAYLIPFTVLPSGLWRMALYLLPHHPLVRLHTGTGYRDGAAAHSVIGLPMWLYVIVLSLFSEALGFLAVGLVSTWGEVYPRWIPLLGGRRVRPKSAIVPAAVGSVILTAMWTGAFLLILTGRRFDGSVTGNGTWQAGFIQVVGGTDWRAWVFGAAYLPLFFWGPLLGAVTYAYAKRRRVEV